MTDINWLSNQAQQIHAVFMSLFYVLITVFLLLGVFVEYFKWPLGQTPSFSVLIGRTLVAALLIHTYPVVSNTLADISDAMGRQLGDLNQFKLVLSKMGDHLGTLTFSWVSVKDTITMAISFVSFFLLYFSIHIVEAFLMYTWSLLYVFSPLLIAFFVLPSTAGATRGLYKSLIEVSLWKIVWSVLATLLWSSALSDINHPGQDFSFISVICYNLLLAGSILLTPIVVHSLAGAGLSNMAQTVGAVAVGAATFSPGRVISAVTNGLTKGKNVAGRTARHFKEKSPSKSNSLYKGRDQANSKCLSQAPSKPPTTPPKVKKVPKPPTSPNQNRAKFASPEGELCDSH